MRGRGRRQGRAARRVDRSFVRSFARSPPDERALYDATERAANAAPMIPASFKARAGTTSARVSM